MCAGSTETSAQGMHKARGFPAGEPHQARRGDAKEDGGAGKEGEGRGGEEAV